MGLWQLHVFKQWAIESIESMESLGYKTDRPKERESDDTDEDHDGLLQWVFADLREVVFFLHKAKELILPCTKQGRIERFCR